MNKKQAENFHWLAYKYLREHLQTQAEKLAVKMKKPHADHEFKLELCGMAWAITGMRKPESK